MGQLLARGIIEINVNYHFFSNDRCMVISVTILFLSIINHVEDLFLGITRAKSTETAFIF